ncbi:MAG: glycosyltransferase [Conexivisphaerales archaeon]
MSQPLVSIIIPAYNEEGEICRVLSEMLNQTYPKKEIIVVDDGSTDSTYEEAKICSQLSDNVILLRRPHGGASKARNEGLKVAKGEVIFFAECDSIYSPDYIEKAVDELGKRVDSSAVCLTGAPRVIKRTLATDCIQLENQLQHTYLKSGKIKPFYAWVFKREVFDAIGGFDEALFQAEDKDFFLRMKNAGFKVAWVPGIHWWHKRDQTLLELASKWAVRSRFRVLYCLKHRKVRELLRGLIPLWTVVISLTFFFYLPLVGMVLLILMASAIMFKVLQAYLTLEGKSRLKVIFIEYPLFLATRSLTSALGYTYGLVKYALLRPKARSISYSNL